MAFAVPFGSVAGPEQLKTGLHATVSDRVRIPPQSFDPRIKNYQWLDLVCGLFEAFDKDRDIPLLRDANGNLTEGPGFNLFIVKDGKVSTPDSGVRELSTNCSSAITIPRGTTNQARSCAATSTLFWTRARICSISPRRSP